MLITSSMLPLKLGELEEIQTFCAEARESKRLIVCGGMPELLRRDYLDETLSLPDRAISHINVPADTWRRILKLACSKIARIVPSSAGDTVVHYLWRAGLVFLFGFQEIGVKRHFHFGLRRNEKNPNETEEIYLDMSGEVDQYGAFNHVVADVMLATGGSFSTVIKKLRQRGIEEYQITLVCLIASPEGIYNLLNEYPGIHIIAGALDDHLDHLSYIVPGLGDAGDKLFRRLTKQYFFPVIDLFGTLGWRLLQEKIAKANPKVEVETEV